MHSLIAAGRRIAERLLAEILPADCLLCGTPLPWRQSGGVCLPCWSLLPWSPGLRPGRGPLEAVVWAGDYSGSIRRLIRALKFEGRDHLGPLLGRQVTRRLAPALRLRGPRIDLVLPVPLHWWRRYRRGYNQAEPLAAPLAEALGAPLAIDLLRRRRAGRRQLGLSRRDRLRALRGCYAASPAVAGKIVLVVDDVLTTGATLLACAAALRRAGAAGVIGCVVARTPERRVRGPSPDPDRRAGVDVTV